MSSGVSQAFKVLQDVLVMNEKVARLSTLSEQLQRTVADHGERLVRIETMIELARAGHGGRATRRLPPGGGAP